MGDPGAGDSVSGDTLRGDLQETFARSRALRRISIPGDTIGGGLFVVGGSLCHRAI